MKPRKVPWDWIESAAKVAHALGLNPVKVRWKLTRWQDSLKQKTTRAVDTASHVGYAHRMCPQCGRVQDNSAKKCANCGASLGFRFIEVLNRIGLVSPHLSSVSSILIVAIVGCYLRTLAAGGFSNILTIDWKILYRFGGSYAPLILDGEWFRLGTSVFLHAGLWHLGFNIFALAEIGPEIESIFGRARLIFTFMVTGILASASSLLWSLYVSGFLGIGIGASGAIMGLIGMAAAWGHKDGTTIGRTTRNMMIKWLAYTIIFGFFIGADNVAHVGGFASGALFGWFAKPKTRRRSPNISIAFALIGTALAIAAVFLVLFPPSLSLVTGSQASQIESSFGYE